jgi:hypothetical protein
VKVRIDSRIVQEEIGKRSLTLRNAADASLFQRVLTKSSDTNAECKTSAPGREVAFRQHKTIGSETARHCFLLSNGTPPDAYGFKISQRTPPHEAPAQLSRTLRIWVAELPSGSIPKIRSTELADRANIEHHSPKVCARHEVGSD